MAIRSGDLNKRLSLLRASDTTNALGEPDPTWSLLGTVWAAKADVSDGEKVKAAGVELLIDTRFTVRASSLTRSLTTADRLMCGGRLYDITGLKDVEAETGIEISAGSRGVQP